MSKYSKNFILCGDIDFFCLFCNESFELADDVEKHIRWEQHRKHTKGQECLPKFKKDGVYKIIDKYFCEVCNYITPTLNTIKNHVKEDSHKAKKECPADIKKESLVKREFGFIVVSKIVMNKKVWHGVVNSQCLTCNAPVEDFSKHIASPGHMISLIGAEIVKKEDDKIYRKIKEDTVYCFKCKKILSAEVLTSHWSSKEHTGGNDHGNEKIKNLFEIDRESSTATCIVCHETIIWNIVCMNLHRDKHVKKGEWEKDENETQHTFLQLVCQDHGKTRSMLKKYGKDNFIKLNEGGSKGYCTLCNTHISAHIRNFTQHVSGVRHKSFLELKGIVKKVKKAERPKFKTKPFVQYFKEVILVKDTGTFLVPSFELCISLLSFALMAHIDENKAVCFICDEIFTDVKVHFTKEHNKKLFAADVVMSLKNEFVREIRPGLYHCGVCNMAYAGWSVLEKHFNLFKHKYAKLEAHKMITEIVDLETLEAQGNQLDPSNFTDFRDHLNLD